MSADASSSGASASPPPGHRPTDSSASLASVASHTSQASVSFAAQESYFEPNEEEEESAEEEGDENSPDRKLVQLWFTQPFKHSLRLFTSHNGFRSAVEMTGDETSGFQARVPAKKGQDLLWRFEVDGEMQTSGDAHIVQVNGQEYNYMHVSQEEEEEAASDAASADGSSKAHRRKSSKLVWDNTRSNFLIAEGEQAKDGAADGSSAKKSDSSASSSAVAGDDDVTLVETSVNAPRTSPKTPTRDDVLAVEDEQSSDEEEAGGASSAATELSRTQRKNARHRQKLKERAAFVTPKSSSSQYGDYSRPTAANGANGSMQNGAPSQVASQALLQVHRLRMELQQRENDWKEAWLVHEMRTFQQREAERAALKAQMSEERTRWLNNLKAATDDLKAAREENVALKAEVSAQASAKKIEKLTSRRSDKFQTLQKNVLNEEMMVWIQDKNRLQAEIETLKNEAAEQAEEKAAISQSLTQANQQVTQLKISLEARERDIASVAADKAELVAQLANNVRAGADAGAEAKQLQEQLAAAQLQVSTVKQEANQVREQLAQQTAEVASLQQQLSAHVSEVEAAKASASSKVAAAEAAREQLKSEVNTLQTKLLAAQEDLFKQQTELEAAQLDRESAEQRESSLEVAHALRVGQLEASLAQARETSAVSAGKISSLSSQVGALRTQVFGLGELQRQQAAHFTKSLQDAQTFLVDALQVQSALLSNTMRKYKKEMSERRKLHNVVQELRGNIRVYCRTRPPTESELADGGCAIVVSPPDEAGEASTELTLDLGKKEGPKSFEFDAVFGPQSSQAEVFAQMQSLVTSVLDGYATCLFAYGQTGAGKTHTMSGNSANPGMNLRSLTELFRLREERREDTRYDISVQFFEIYNENVYDLLDTNREKEIKIRQGPTGVFVEGLVSRAVQSEADVLALMEEGSRNRTTHGTSMNAQSSRSHSVLSVHVHGASAVMGVQLRGTLNLVDLAGSERVGRTNATGERLKEAQAINLSLSALGNCIEALQKKQSHVPYRNSKLTHILSASLGGNSKTLMIANISPATRDAEETACTLLFAARVRATEIGVASKNVSSAPAAADPSAAGSAAAAAVTSPKAKTAASSSSAPGSAPKPRVGSAAPGSAVKKPATAAAGTPLKKPAAK